MIVKDIIRRNNITIEGNLQSKNTLIFGNGFGTGKQVWDAVKTFFETEYKIILFDNVGGGNSDINAYNSAKYQSLEGYADDLIEICTELQLTNVFFIGHSAGAMIGILASLNAPGIFTKMVLIGASPRYLNDPNYTGGFDQHALDEIYLQIKTNYVKWVSGFSKMTMRNEDRPYLSTQFAESLLSLRPDISLEVTKSIFQSDFRLVLKFIECQVLIVQSKNDIAVPQAVAEYLHSKIRGSKLVIINADGHFPHISAPGAVAAVLSDFFASI